MTPLPLKDGSLLIDNSTLELLRCPKLLEYRWLQQRELVASRAGRNFGSTIHVGLAVRHNEAGANAVTPEVEINMCGEMLDYLHEFPQPEGDFRNYNHACTVVKAYNNIYANEPFTILKSKGDYGVPIVEASFAFPLGEVHSTPIVYCGKIDLGIEDNAGLWSFDTKTAFQFGDTWDAQMRRDGGQLGYCWALGQFLERKPVGYIINGIRIRKPSRKGEYEGLPPVDATDFKRMPVPVSQDELDEWRDDVLHLVSDIFWHYDRGYFPRARWNCTNKFGKCDMFDVCAAPTKQRDFILNDSGLYVKSEWSPLKEPKTKETKETVE